jgi:hypothetical protein
MIRTVQSRLRWGSPSILQLKLRRVSLLGDGWRKAGNHVRSCSKGARDPLGFQDHKIRRLGSDFENEGLENCGDRTRVDDSKVQICILCGNGNTIPISLSGSEGIFRSQPGLAAVSLPYNMRVPPPAGYVSLANIAELECSGHGRASIVNQRAFDWTLRRSLSLAEAQVGRVNSGGLILTAYKRSQGPSSRRPQQ